MELCVYSNRDMGLDLFGCHIISPARVQNRVVKGILSLITKERQAPCSHRKKNRREKTFSKRQNLLHVCCINRHGETVDRVLLKNLLTMLVDLRVSFLPFFLLLSLFFTSSLVPSLLSPSLTPSLLLSLPPSLPSSLSFLLSQYNCRPSIHRCTAKHLRLTFCWRRKPSIAPRVFV